MKLAWFGSAPPLRNMSFVRYFECPASKFVELADFSRRSSTNAGARATIVPLAEFFRSSRYSLAMTLRTSGQRRRVTANRTRRQSLAKRRLSDCVEPSNRHRVISSTLARLISPRLIKSPAEPVIAIDSPVATLATTCRARAVEHLLRPLDSRRFGRGTRRLGLPTNAAEIESGKMANRALDC